MSSNAIKVIILQHPAEQDSELGTATLVLQVLKECKVITGLSWPNFEKAIGYKADPKKWAVLYLGSVKLPEDKDLVLIDRYNKIIEDDATIKAAIEGIVVLDGTWSQAKALWWRNPWLLKLNRIAIKPFQPSLYGKLRKEPRKESVSTLEAIAATLTALGEPIDTSRSLLSAFRKHLEEYRKNNKPVAKTSRKKIYKSNPAKTKISKAKN